jgi:hypothetical protein
MTDFERWLREAMAAAAEPPPAGLIDGIRRRHRRHLRRVGAASLAAVAVAGIAVPVGAREVSGQPEPTATSPAAGSPAAASPGGTPTAAPGTVLRDCQSSEGGTVSADWQESSVHAGPVWFIFMRPKNASQRLTSGKLTASAMVIAIANGKRAVVTAGPATGGRYRFLATFNNDGRPYTMTEGAPGLTLAGCPAGPAGTNIPASYAPGLTMFWEGYVTDLRGCIPLEVRTSADSAPIRVTISGPGCGSSA